MSWFWFDNRVMISKIRISTYKSIQRGETKCEQCNRDYKGTEITVKKSCPGLRQPFQFVFRNCRYRVLYKLNHNSSFGQFVAGFYSHRLNATCSMRNNQVIHLHGFENQ